MAQKVVTRRNGEKVTLTLGEVNRAKRLVVIHVLGYNASFQFTDAGGRVVLIPNGRQVIDPGSETIGHVSQSVYNGMVQWAAAILHEKRHQLQEQST